MSLAEQRTCVKFCNERRNIDKEILYPSQPDLLYLLVVYVEGYCYNWWHSMTPTTPGRTPLDGGSDHRRDIYQTTHILKRQASMLQTGFNPKILAGQSLQTEALDRTASKIALRKLNAVLTSKSRRLTVCTTSCNIQKFCVLSTMHLYVLCGSQNKQRLFLSSSLVFSPKAGFGRNQSPVRRPVWLWHTAF